MSDGGTTRQGTLLDRLEAQPSDSLLALIALANADPRPDKIDVGVGVYRDSAGNTPILRSVKAAERALLVSQETKSYIDSQGDVRFTELIAELVFGAGARMADVADHPAIRTGYPGLSESLWRAASQQLR